MKSVNKEEEEKTEHKNEMNDQKKEGGGGVRGDNTKLGVEKMEVGGGAMKMMRSGG